MTHLGDVVFRHVCMHKAHIRARPGYEPTHEAAMAARQKLAAEVKGECGTPAGRRIQNDSGLSQGLARPF
jgi:hypothetical protein